MVDIDVPYAYLYRTSWDIFITNMSINIGNISSMFGIESASMGFSGLEWDLTIGNGDSNMLLQYLIPSGNFIIHW